MISDNLSFLKELNAIKNEMRQDMDLKVATFKELVALDMTELDESACPAIVLAVSHANGYHGEKSIALGAVMQLVFVADKVHLLMKDDDEEMSEELRQFPVLVGDFLYGKFFLKLSQEKILDFLSPIARVIETMSEGSISRWLVREEKPSIEQWMKIFERERASLTGLAARIAAQVAGASLQIQEKSEAFGRKLGLAWAAWQEKMAEAIVLDMLLDAKKILLDDFPDSSRFQQLYEVYEFFEANLFPKVDLETVN